MFHLLSVAALVTDSLVGLPVVHLMAVGLAAVHPFAAALADCQPVVLQPAVGIHGLVGTWRDPVHQVCGPALAPVVVQQPAVPVAVRHWAVPVAVRHWAGPVADRHWAVPVADSHWAGLGFGEEYIESMKHEQDISNVRKACVIEVRGLARTAYFIPGRGCRPGLDFGESFRP